MTQCQVDATFPDPALIFHKMLTVMQMMTDWWIGA